MYISGNLKPSTVVARIAQVNGQKHPQRVLLRRRLRADRAVSTSALLRISNERRKGNKERKIERERERERAVHFSAVALTSLSPPFSLSLSLSLACQSYLCLSLSLSLAFSTSLSLSLSPPLLALTAAGLGGGMRHSRHGRACCQSALRPTQCDRRKGRAERERI